MLLRRRTEVRFSDKRSRCFFLEAVDQEVFSYYTIKSVVCQMMHRLRRYDVFRFAQNDVAPLRSAMMRCLRQNVAKPRIIREANIIRRSRHHLRDRQTSFKKRTFVGRQKCVFCWWGMVKHIKFEDADLAHQVGANIS